jgi:glycosyltransferase involved in cell wall biosynthesis
VNVAVVTVLPTSYRAPLYDAIDARLRAREGSLTVIYGAAMQPGRQWADAEPTLGGTRSIILTRGQVRFGGRSMYVNPGVTRSLARVQPDIVVVGGFSPWIYAAAAWCTATKTPYLVWSGETLQSAAASGRRRLRRWPITRGAAGFIAYGPDAKEYLLSIGLPGDRITVMGNGIDIDGFGRRVDAARAAVNEVRSRFGLRKRVVLSVGGKGLDLVLRALTLMKDDAQLAVAGTISQGLHANGVIELGRLPSIDMPGLYAAASCVAHPPAFDMWPHAINEALSAGVPVVGTPHTGLPDSVFQGPGCAVVPRKAEALAAALDEAVRVGSERSSVVRAAITDPLRPWGVNAMADRAVLALREIV